MIWAIVLGIINRVRRHWVCDESETGDCSCFLCFEAWEARQEQKAEDWKTNDGESDPLADSLGIDPVKLENGCGCDRPRWEIRPCGHCACESECNDCPANKLWRDEQESWCGCARPGEDGVLACGHCDCGYGCFEVVRGESHAAPHKAPCVV